MSPSPRVAGRSRSTRLTSSPANARQGYVISAPTGFVTASSPFRNALLSFHSASRGVKVLASVHEDADKLVAMTDEEVRALRVRHPKLTIEPNILYRKLRHPVLEGFEQLYYPASAATKVVRIRVVEARTGDPVAKAQVYAGIGGRTGAYGVTSANGNVSLRVRATVATFSWIAVVPAHGFWSRQVMRPPAASLEIGLTALPSPKTERYDWGHQFSGMRRGAGAGGARVVVGVVDSGIRRDHPDLRVAGGVNCVTGEPESHWYKDEDGHGTHCAGVIAALVNGAGIRGYAPDVDLRAYRVFATGADGATTFDIATALQRAIEDGCDIISMSLGSESAQTAIRNKIELAYDRGVVCIAATGNESGPVNYPAAFPNVFGVGAFGQAGTYPPDSIHADAESPIRDRTGRLFLASFSNRGSQQVDFCAPGVAVISTVPGGYAAWDGTSMACPQVAGMAALAIASRPSLRDAPREAARVDAIEQVLRRAADPIGFGSTYEGTGALKVSKLVARTTRARKKAAKQAVKKPSRKAAKKATKKAAAKRGDRVVRRTQRAASRSGTADARAMADPPATT